MTPEERAVIDAAKAYDWTPSDTARLADLRAAVQALRRSETRPDSPGPGRPDPGA